jgi:hypothetical protein
LVWKFLKFHDPLLPIAREGVKKLFTIGEKLILNEQLYELLIFGRIFVVFDQIDYGFNQELVIGGQVRTITGDGIFQLHFRGFPFSE